MTAILEQLNQLASEKSSSLKDWFREILANNQPFFYNSCDIRYSGDKIAPIDTNIFPAGFNNLSEASRLNAGREVKEFLKDSQQKILIFAEFHTRNLNYLDNVKIIEELLKSSGREVKIAYFSDEETETLNLQTAKNKNITLYPLKREGSKIYVDKDFFPDLIIVNNDFTAGVPEILENTENEIIPNPKMGWHNRSKYKHFESYNNLVKKFAKEFGVDEFLISTEIGFCKNVNFKERDGIEDLVKKTDLVLKNLKEKYLQYDIKTPPYVFLKADKGTYGMGIMVVSEAEELYKLNKKERNKMSIIKNNTKNAEILIQEGIPTIDSFEGAAAEPFIYFINGKEVGGILRINKTRDNLSNLNSKGVEFAELESYENYDKKALGYSLIARLAITATALECQKF